jgi:hypothetical protein
LSPVPLWLRLAGGTGGISLWRDISIFSLEHHAKGFEEFWFQKVPAGETDRGLANSTDVRFRG